MDISQNDKNSFSDNEEIDITPFFRTLLREKKIILSISLIASIFSAIFTYLEKPVWRGNFQIVISELDTNKNNLVNNNVLSNFLDSKVSDYNIKTQEFILKSPSVLNPIFEYVKKEKNIDNDKNTYLYEDWVNGSLGVSIKRGSNVINVSYKDKNKEFILDILEKISFKYQEYSIRDTEKEVLKQINYLEKQSIILGDKLKESEDKLNLFKIENGLGQFDELISLDKGNKSFEDNFGDNSDNQNFKKDQIINKRFSKQFMLLEQYESDYVKFSTIFKPESNKLKNLKLKIENIKSFLKVPSEILIKYKNLERIAKKDALILNKVQDNLSLLKLQQAKELKPWNIISEPSLEKRKISPQRKRRAISAFIYGFIISIIFAYIKEKKSDIIYEENHLKKNINLNLIGKIYRNSQNLNDNLIAKSISSDDFELIIASDLMNDKYEGISQKYNISRNKFEDHFSKSNPKDIILLVEKGKVLNSDIKNINKYIDSFKEKFSGWLLLEKN